MFHKCKLLSLLWRPSQHGCDEIFSWCWPGFLWCPTRCCENTWRLGLSGELSTRMTFSDNWILSGRTNFAMINFRSHMSRWKAEETGTKAAMVPSSLMVQPQCSRRSAQAEEEQLNQEIFRKVEASPWSAWVATFIFPPSGLSGAYLLIKLLRAIKSVMFKMKKVIQYKHDHHDLLQSWSRARQGAPRHSAPTFSENTCVLEA